MNMRKFATSLTIGSFAISALTGVLIFLEFAPGGVRSAHEWMSLLFLAAGALHIFTHKNSFFRYFSGKYLVIMIATFFTGIVLYALSFNDIYASGTAFDKLVNARIEHLAPILNIDSETLVRRINATGVTVTGTDLSLNDIATANAMDVYDLIEPLLKE